MTDRASGFHVSSDRQQKVAAYAEIAFSDLTSGVAKKAIWVPAGAFDLEGKIIPITAFNSATSDVLDVGTEGSPNAYKDDGNIHTTTVIALAGFPGAAATAGYWIYVTWVGVGAAPTAGKFKLVLYYLLENRSQFNHGEDK